MPWYDAPGSSIEGKKILCVFEDDPRLRSDGNGKGATLKGNPAIAVIDKVWKWVE